VSLHVFDRLTSENLTPPPVGNNPQPAATGSESRVHIPRRSSPASPPWTTSRSSPTGVEVKLERPTALVFRSFQRGSGQSAGKSALSG